MLRWTIVTVAICGLTSCGDSSGSNQPTPLQRAAFRDATLDSGVEFTLRTGFRDDFALPEITLGGVALFDGDDDGDLDLYLTDGGSLAGSDAQPRGGTDKLFSNDGSARFDDVTSKAGVVRRSYGMGASAADVDGDGKVDLYLASLGADQLWGNAGDLRFVENESFQGVDSWSTSCSFFDADRDGDLDLWVARYVRFDPEQTCSDFTDQRDFCGPMAYRAETDVFLRNDGAGSLRDASAEVGIVDLAEAGLGVAVDDYDSDGWLDVFVANDLGANHLWRNDGKGQFLESALLLGVAFDLHGAAEAGMGVVWEDLDGDETADLFLTHLRGQTNTFYRGVSGTQMSYVDTTGDTGISRSSLPMTGFGLNAFDADWDGDLDLFVANGAVQRGEVSSESALPAPWNAYAEHDSFYENLGQGRFTERPKIVGRTPAIGRGSATGDLDGDGDFDIVVTSIESSVRILLNEVQAQGDWFGLDVRELGRAAHGARVEIVGPVGTTSRRVRTDGSFLASGDPRVFCAQPNGTESIDVRVTWVDGVRESFQLTGSRRVHRIQRGDGQ